MPSYYKEILLFCYGICSIIGFALMGLDKQCAKNHKWRISENVLMIFACIGGIGVWSGMYIFHHKTRKPKFYIGVPICIILCIIIMIYI